jgi:hypothetical protein
MASRSVDKNVPERDCLGALGVRAEVRLDCDTDLRCGSRRVFRYSGCVAAGCEYAIRPCFYFVLLR